MKMENDLDNIVSTKGSKAVILITASITFIVSSLILFSLDQIGIVAFTGAGWIVNILNLVSDYLGSSIIFFTPTLIAYIAFFLLASKSLSTYQEETDEAVNLKYYTGGMDLCTSLFVGIGVIYTSYGISNALVTAIANLNQEEAGRLGAWGILRKLVDNGILIALWTTIIGSAGAYFMRFFRYVFHGRALTRIAYQAQKKEKDDFFSALDAIKVHVESIDDNLHRSG